MAKSGYKFDEAGFWKEAHDLGMQILKEAGKAMVVRVKQSIEDSPPDTSKTYYREGGRRHHPSFLGNPPVIDYGRLYDSISVNWSDSNMENGEIVKGRGAIESDGVKRPTDPDKVKIGSSVPYAEYLEEGYLNRPFLRPQQAQADEDVKVGMSKLKSKISTKEFRSKYIKEK